MWLTSRFGFTGFTSGCGCVWFIRGSDCVGLASDSITVLVECVTAADATACGSAAVLFFFVRFLLLGYSASLWFTIGTFPIVCISVCVVRASHLLLFLFPLLLLFLLPRSSSSSFFFFPLLLLLFPLTSLFPFLLPLSPPLLLPTPSSFPCSSLLLFPLPAATPSPLAPRNDFHSRVSSR